MSRHNADYWDRQDVREYGSLAFALLFFGITLGLWLL